MNLNHLLKSESLETEAQPVAQPLTELSPFLIGMSEGNKFIWILMV